VGARTPDASGVAMQVVSVISTKGGVGKTTVTANLGGLLADAGLRVLLLDLDVQPTLSSYYEPLVVCMNCWPSMNDSLKNLFRAQSSRIFT